MNKKSPTRSCSKQNSITKKDIISSSSKTKNVAEASSRKRLGYAAPTEVSKSKSISASYKYNKSPQNSGRTSPLLSKQSSVLQSKGTEGEEDDNNDLNSHLMAIIELSKRQYGGVSQAGIQLKSKERENNIHKIPNIASNNSRDQIKIFTEIDISDGSVHNKPLVRTPTLGALQDGSEFHQDTSTSYNQNRNSRSPKLVDNILSDLRLNINDSKSNKILLSPHFRVQPPQPFTIQKTLNTKVGGISLSDIQELQRMQTKLDEYRSNSTQHENEIDYEPISETENNRTQASRCLTESHMNYSQSYDQDDSHTRSYRNKNCLTEAVEDTSQTPAFKVYDHHANSDSKILSYIKKYSLRNSALKRSGTSPQRSVCNTERAKRCENTPPKTDNFQRRDSQKPCGLYPQVNKKRDLTPELKYDRKYDRILTERMSRSPTRTLNSQRGDSNKSPTFKELDKSANFGQMSSRDTLKHYQQILRSAKLFKQK